MRQFVYGLDYIDEQVAQIMPSGKVRFVLQDANYNVTGIVSEEGQDLIRQFSYDPYGPLLAAEDGDGAALTSSDINESWHMFQGRWYDANTGLIYFRGRWYNPKTGRWLSRDPNGQALALMETLAMNGQTRRALASFSAYAQYEDGMNPYAFVGSNPIVYRDPNGRIILVAGVAIGVYEAALIATAAVGTLYVGGTLLGAAIGDLYAWYAQGIDAQVKTMSRAEPISIPWTNVRRKSDCTEQRLDTLRRIKQILCDRPRKCHHLMSKSVLLDQIRKNLECQDHRLKIMEECYRDRHWRKAEEVDTPLRKCRDLLERANGNMP